MTTMVRGKVVPKAPMYSAKTASSSVSTSRRSSVFKAPDKKDLGIKDESLAEEDTSGKNQQTIKFVYSEAVEKAFRRDFQCTCFGPLSAAVTARRRAREPGISISRVTELYRDFNYIRHLVHHNRSYIEKLQDELGDTLDALESERNTKLQKNANKNSFSLSKSRQKSRSRSGSVTSNASSITKLPPIMMTSGMTSSMSSTDRQSSSGSSFIQPT